MIDINHFPYLEERQGELDQLAVRTGEGVTPEDDREGGAGCECWAPGRVAELCSQPVLGCTLNAPHTWGHTAEVRHKGLRLAAEDGLPGIPTRQQASTQHRGGCQLEQVPVLPQWATHPQELKKKSTLVPPQCSTEVAEVGTAQALMNMVLVEHHIVQQPAAGPGRGKEVGEEGCPPVPGHAAEQASQVVVEAGLVHIVGGVGLGFRG